MGMPRARASIATWLRGAAAAQRNGAALAPVGFEKAGGRQVFSHQNGTRLHAGRRLAGERAQHPVAKVLEVRRAGTEIIIVRGLIACDLAGHRKCPGLVGRHAGRDGVECGLRQRLVFQHGKLKGQNVLPLALDPCHQIRHAARRRRDRVTQGFGLLCRISGGAALRMA